MEFDFVSKNRVRAVLTAEDIRLAGLRPDDSEYDSRRLRRYLLHLLAQIKAQADFPLFENGSLSIELLPDESGGAVIWFCSEPASEVSTYRHTVFRFESSRQLIDAALKLSKCDFMLKSKLYQAEAGFFLIILSRPGEDAAALRLLSEYGEQLFFGEDETAALCEHFRPMIRERAVDLLTYYFG